MKTTGFTLAHDLEESKPPENVFLASGLAIFRWICLYDGWLLLLFALTFGRQFAPLPVWLVGYLAGMIFLGLPVSFSLKWFCRIRVVEKGIRGGTYWGTPVYMTWAEMESVEPKSLLGLPYLRIKSFRENCPPLWVPRFLAEKSGFRETVQSLTSTLHPLRRSLENGETSERRSGLPMGAGHS